MTEEIIVKLRNALSQPFKSEWQVVYILSRIRKLLESETSDYKYPSLSFYCDISLHSQIDRTRGKDRHAILEEFIKNPSSTHKFGFHTEFSKEMNDFLIAHGLATVSEDNLSDFIFELGNVISDTPIKVNLDRVEYTIIFKAPRNKNESGLRIITPPYRFSN